MAVIELGAGEAIPTVRRQSEFIARKDNHLIRINPRDYKLPWDLNNLDHIPLELGALDALTRLDKLIVME